MITRLMTTKASNGYKICMNRCGWNLLAGNKKKNVRHSLTRLLNVEVVKESRTSARKTAVDVESITRSCRSFPVSVHHKEGRQCRLHWGSRIDLFTVGVLYII